MNDVSYIDLNIPLLIFFSIFLAIVILFLIGQAFMITARGDIVREEKGRRIFWYSFFGFLGCFLIFITYFTIDQLFRIPEPRVIQEGVADLPPSRAINFPPQPKYVRIGSYYFNGPWNRTIQPSSLGDSFIYSLLCAREDEYDIIDVGLSTNLERASANEECWVKNCPDIDNKLAIAFLVTPQSQYLGRDSQNILDKIRGEATIACSNLN